MSYTTEPPFTGKYTDTFEEGIYRCHQCKAPLFTSESKFHSGCGWPSFDKAIPSAVERLPDPDGERTEIRCAQCHAHLGHLFVGEFFTPANMRYCVNSYALSLEPKKEVAVFGGGCFWCTEALFSRKKGVLSVTPGYAGGEKENPSYEEVCTGSTGHAEVVRVEFDPSVISYEELLSFFWQIHDPTSLNRQGHDVGSQYRSVLLYTSKEQKKIIEESLQRVAKEYTRPIVTDVQPLKAFYEAEPYHKDYFANHPEASYCQLVIVPKMMKYQ